MRVASLPLIRASGIFSRREEGTARSPRPIGEWAGVRGPGGGVQPGVSGERCPIPSGPTSGWEPDRLTSVGPGTESLIYGTHLHAFGTDSQLPGIGAEAQVSTVSVQGTVSTPLTISIPVAQSI